MINYDRQHEHVDEEIEELKGEDETDDHAFALVAVGLHTLIDIAESLDSLNHHAEAATREALS